MKIRHGFVSNSSTSSFIFVGFAVPQKDFDIKDFLLNGLGIGEEELKKYNNLEDNIFDILDEYSLRECLVYSEDDGSPTKDTILIGREIDSIDSDCGVWMNGNPINILDVINEVNLLAQKSKIEINSDMKIYMLTRMC